MDYRQFHSGLKFTPIGSMSLPNGESKFCHLHGLDHMISA